MPHISIKMYPGRTEEVKKGLAENWKEEVADKIRPEELYVKANF